MILGSRTRLVTAVCFGCGVYALTGCGAYGQPEGDDEAVARLSSPIVGGVLAEPCEHPATVAAIYPDGEVFCAGTLVDPLVVVTAAHCLEDDFGDVTPPADVRVVVGHQDVAAAPGAERRQVASIIPHPNYEPYPQVDNRGMGQSNDIGLIVLQSPVTDVPPAGIPGATAAAAMTAPGRRYAISGFGSNDYTGDPDNPGPDGVLYRAAMDYRAHIDIEVLAGSTDGQDTCFGDSGGPAYAVEAGGMWLVGATSRVGAMASVDCGEETIFALVPSYRDWIESAAGITLKDEPGQSLCPGTGGAGGNPGAGGSGAASAAPDESSDDDGCGCRQPGRAAPSAPAGLALALAAMVLVRRRSRRGAKARRQ